jgi:F0F1-type ATP synthase assembly protein I
MLVGSLVGWLIGWLIDHLLLMESGPYGIIFMNVCVGVIVAMVILLRDFGPCGIIFIDFPVIFDGQFTSH